jgi:hypothetical protein
MSEADIERMTEIERIATQVNLTEAYNQMQDWVRELLADYNGKG